MSEAQPATLIREETAASIRTKGANALKKKKVKQNKQHNTTTKNETKNNNKWDQPEPLTGNDERNYVQQA